jgi:hypothetical protein
VGIGAVRLERLWPNRPVTARNAELAAIVAEKVSDSTAFVGIVTPRRGARIAGSERTFLQHEWEVAQKSGLPLFIYAHPECGLFARLVGDDEPTQYEMLVLADCVALAAVESPDVLYERVKQDLAAWLNKRETSRRLVVLPRVSSALLSQLLRDPTELANCPARVFEELIGDLLRDDGWDVQLVTRLNAPGPDIIACAHQLVRGQPLRMIVECKRYAQNRRVDIREVRNLVYWLNEEYTATLGMIATSSTFTKNALKAVEERHRWRISLKDHSQILSWLASSKLVTELSLSKNSKHAVLRFVSS